MLNTETPIVWNRPLILQLTALLSILYLRPDVRGDPQEELFTSGKRPLLEVEPHRKQNFRI